VLGNKNKRFFFIFHQIDDLNIKDTSNFASG